MSSVNIDAPGAYPITPLNEEPVQQKQHNKLHKREDPRGWDSNAEQETYPSSHNLTGGPGIHAEESSLGHGAYPTTSSTTSSYQNPSQQTLFSKQEPHSVDNDAHSSGRHFNNSGIYVDDSSLSRGSENSKPGVMTGAVSRVSNQVGTYTQNNNYTYDKQSVSPPTYGETTGEYDNTKSAATATSGVASTHNTSDSANRDSNVDATTISSTNADNNHNNVQSGLGRQSNVEHKEPYWGDIPFGAGVYNGVTGHGSDELTSHERRTHDQDSNSATNIGIHNGVIGHGSNESTSHHRSIRDQNTTTSTGVYNGVTGHGSNADTAAASKFNHGDEQRRESHFKEGLAGASATAAGGYAAHEYANKHTDKVNTKHEQPKESGESKLHALLHPHSHKDKKAEHKHEEVKSTSGVTKHEKKEQALPHRAFAAAPDENQTERQKLERQPQNTSHENKAKEDSNLGYYGAAAATAGAGAYGAHKYANRDSSKEHSSVPENKQAPLGTSHSITHEPVRDNAPLVGGNVMSHTANREKPRHEQYNTLSDGTPSGIASSGTKYSHDSTNSRAPHKAQYSTLTDGVPSGIAADRTQDEGRVSSDSSHGGQYNILSSGTPSGINMENVHHPHGSSPTTAGSGTSFSDKYHQQKQSTFLSNSPHSPSHTGEKASGASSGAQPSGLGRSQYEIKDAANQGQALRDFEKSAKAAALRSNQENEQGSGTKQTVKKENLDLAGGAQNKTLIGHVVSGRKVTHRCTKCGEENDITEHLRG
ncbi:hypothetical protein HD806DRAFT_179864 [Xylariaceae sp. AK1471]|nr:hypothetical protein HD806DRAFT_179864 [Xylariaceae sp. AK1471]